MRRGSLVGPIILILLGGIFLLNNLRPDLSLLDLISSGWPYLLIGWGTLRLAEIFFWMQNNRPIPVNGVTGGEWALIVMICLFGSGVFLVHDNRSNWARRGLLSHGVDFFGDHYDYQLNAKTAAKGSRRLLIENLQGNVHVVGGDGDDVQVSGHKSIRAMDKQTADAADRETALELEVKDGRVIVRTNQHRSTGESRVSADLEITAPRGMTVECHGRQGDYDISQITGGAELDSDSGDVRLQDIGGAARLDLRRSSLIRVSSLKGSVDIKGHGQDVELEDIGGPVVINGSFGGELQFQKLAQPVQFKGSEGNEFRAERIPGQVRLARNSMSGNSIVGPIVVSARSQDVQLSDFTQALNVNVDKGDLDLAPAPPALSKMVVRTHSGNVELAIPDGAGFDLDGTSNKGEVDNEYGDALTIESGKRGGTLRGKIGQGPLLTVVTDRGTLTVRKSSESSSSATQAHSATPPKAPRAPQPAPVEQQ